MNITLKPEQEKFIQSQIERGRFTNTDQVIDIAFELLANINDDYIKWVRETRQKLDVAIQELDQGEGLDGETVMMKILEKFKKAR
ncbi:MAG TPA: type II toxin-antitoxin system ParD family antitoxin [Allocoleopsis sp.]